MRGRWVGGKVGEGKVYLCMSCLCGPVCLHVLFASINNCVQDILTLLEMFRNLEMFLVVGRSERQSFFYHYE